MIYNTKNRSNDTTENQKEKTTYFNAHYQYSQSKNHGTKITCTSQFVLMSCPRYFALMFCDSKSGFVLSLF